LITENSITKLPEPIQKYLKSSQIIGKSMIKTANIVQEGLLRTQPEQAWAPIKTIESYTINPPAFLWKGQTTVLPLIKITARDTFTKGKGQMQVKLLSLVKVANASGKEVDQIALLRFLSAMIWFPTALLEDYVSYEPIDNSSVKISLNSFDRKIDGIYKFDDEGKITSLEALRYRSTGQGFEQTKWSISYSTYKEMNNIMVPTESESIWHFDIDNFLYMRTRVKLIQYDRKNE